MGNERLDSRHHLWFNRADYRSTIEKRLRNHHGFVIPLDTLVHNELHATIEPPPKPSPVMIFELFQRLKRSGDTLSQTIKYFEDRTYNGDDISHYDNAQRIADNLNQQRMFINGNQD